ncbi:PepSY domain-containing protein [Actinomycetospora endophytica]|uniref:PepSY domain-containing protein n=1 Tax=Actinomycetospora endophytica TaxID=2291215 RepID=A0ABS8PEJ2_9PSEU|nr:PepSY domain-containing protein [Actinomycetospora endophytica]MCD2196342.1 PepSY domain-containing protein [Actinomycetospora endophytica]
MTLDDRPGTTQAAAPSPPQSGTWDLLRPLILRIHFWAGLLVGPFLLVAALTGFAYTLTPTLQPLVYDHELTVPASAAQVPLADQIRIGEGAAAGAPLKAVRPGATPTDSTQVIFDPPSYPDSNYRTAFVDPHTGELRGVLDTYGGQQAMPLQAWIDQLHRNLHLGDPGRLYTELAASWLWVMVLGGLAMWIGLAWRRRRARAVLVPRVRGGRRARLLSWHAVVGLWAAVGLLVLSATGLTWSTYAGDNVTALRSALSWSTPAPSTKLPPAAVAPGTPAWTPEGFGTAAAVADRTGLVGPVEITPGKKPGQAYSVSQVRKAYPQRLDAIAVDAATGQVTDTVRFADWPLPAKLARWGIDIHMGTLFGLANQILLAALAAGLACIVVWGHVLWWRRGPGQRAGAAPRGGALRALPRRWLIGVAAVTVAVGIALPVLGASLVVFLLAETLLDTRIRGAAAGG